VSRYLVLAGATVFAVILLVLALPHNAHDDTASHFASDARATAGPNQNDRSHTTALPVTGAAPWALSALPECFHQRASRSGTIAFARVLLVGTKPIAAPFRLRAADCTLVVDADSATVVRGDNRLVIPQPVRFFTAGSELVVERRDGARDDVRVYVPRAR
jgi:hypothetical protein